MEMTWMNVDGEKLLEPVVTFKGSQLVIRNWVKKRRSINNVLPISLRHAEVLERTEADSERG